MSYAHTDNYSNILLESYRKNRLVLIDIDSKNSIDYLLFNETQFGAFKHIYPRLKSPSL